MSKSSSPFLFLAASNFSSRELLDFFDWINLNGSKASYKRLEDLRNFGDYEIKNVASLNKSPSRKVDSEEERINEHISMIYEVERLLLEEVGMSKSEATKVIMHELRDIETNYGYLSSPNKRSFRSWLARIGEDVSDSRIVHIASRIRHQVINGNKSISDWPI